MTCLNIKVSSYELNPPPPPPLNTPSHVNAHPPLQDFPNLNALGINPRCMFVTWPPITDSHYNIHAFQIITHFCIVNIVISICCHRLYQNNTCKINRYIYINSLVNYSEANFVYISCCHSHKCLPPDCPEANSPRLGQYGLFYFVSIKRYKYQ